MQYKLFSMQHFIAPTPKKIVRIGNALVALSMSSGGAAAFLSSNKIAGGVIFALGAIGKFLLTFYAVDGSVPDTKTT